MDNAPINVKLGAGIALCEIWTPIDFRNKRSKVNVTGSSSAKDTFRPLYTSLLDLQPPNFNMIWSFLGDML